MDCPGAWKGQLLSSVPGPLSQFSGRLAYLSCWDLHAFVSCLIYCSLFISSLFLCSRPSFDFGWFTLSGFLLKLVEPSVSRQLSMVPLGVLHDLIGTVFRMFFLLPSFHPCTAHVLNLDYGRRKKKLYKVGFFPFMWVKCSVLSIKHTLAIGSIQIGS